MRYFNIPHYKSLVELKRRIDKVNLKGIEIAQRRMEIIRFYDEYGKEATKKAFGVSKETIYNWKKILKLNSNEIRSLIPLSRRPIRRRVSKISSILVEFIREYRMSHPRAGQYVIKSVLDKFCEERGIKKISESSIAKIIKKLKERGEIPYGNKISYNARSGKISVRVVKRKKKERRKGYRPEKAGDLVQIDAISMFRDGVKRYIITAIDVKSKFGFGYAYSNLSSRSAKDFMEKIEYVFPFKIKRVQTDNGSEFEKEFDKYIKEKGLTHYYNYPRHPQSNGCVERFNRTIRENFIDFNEETIFDDITQYNRKLMEWLIWYNGEKRHRSIDMTPIEYILKEKNLDPKKSNMYVNHTLPNPQINLDKKNSKPSENEYYMALVYYSNKAYNTAEIDEDYIESYIAGNYLRYKIRDLNRFKTKSIDNNKGFVSPAVENELNDIFNQKIPIQQKNKISNIRINNFYEIKTVKNGVPFLVQKDSFLKDREVVITFDDGPVSQTQELVNYLSENDAKSIFFILGSKLTQNTQDIIRNMSNKGHSVSVHGFYHATKDGKPFTAYSVEDAIDEILKTDKLIFDCTNKHSNFFRPPYGIIQPQVVSSLITNKKIFPLGWTIDTLDWSIKSPDELFNRTVELIKKRGKGIILLHDIHPQSRDVAKRLVLWLKQNNYKIISHQELLSVINIDN